MTVTGPIPSGIARHIRAVEGTHEATELSVTHRFSRPERGISFWILVAIFSLSPLPFGSVGEIWTPLYGILIGIALIMHVFACWRSDQPLRAVPGILVVAAALVGMVALWGYVQAIPGLFPSLQHPFWAQTAALLQQPEMPGYLSLAPDRSSQVATRYLVYLGFALLVVWHSRRPRDAKLLLTLFVGVQALYALYGLAIFFSGSATILWFERPFPGTVSSTFVNRNNYATFAGLGILAASVLALRYIRRAFDAEKGLRTRLRELIETMASYGWLLALALLLLFAALLLTQSRMGLLAVMIATVVLLAGWVVRLPPGSSRRLGTLLLSLLVVLVAVNFFLSGGATVERIYRLFDAGDLRFNAYPLILDAISERPWLGYGLGAFETAFRAFRDESIQLLFDRAHSDYLELVMDLGWPMAILMMMSFVLLLVAGWRASRTRTDYEFALLSVAATIQIAVHSALDFSMQMPAVVFAYLLVALVGLGRSHSASRPTRLDTPNA